MYHNIACMISYVTIALHILQNNSNYTIAFQIVVVLVEYFYFVQNLFTNTCLLAPIVNDLAEDIAIILKIVGYKTDS